MRESTQGSVRIGSADVDTIIDDQAIVPGGSFTGKVLVQGGDTDQRIRGLEHRLVASTPDEDGVQQVTLDRWKIAEEFVIGAGEQREIPFEAVLHPGAPVTNVNAQYNEMNVWIDTGLSVDRAVDASDVDYLRVSPTGPIQTMLEAVESLGLELYTVSADAGRVTIDGRTARVGYDQEFDFRPTRNYRGPEFDEYQLHFVPRPLENQTSVLIEVEDSGGLLGGDEDIFRSIHIDHVWGYNPEYLAQVFRDRLYDAA
jgi:sporulation-control protein